MKKNSSCLLINVKKTSNFNENFPNLTNFSARRSTPETLFSYKVTSTQNLQLGGSHSGNNLSGENLSNGVMLEGEFPRRNFSR